MLYSMACIWDIITTFALGKFIIREENPDFNITIVWNI